MPLIANDAPLGERLIHRGYLTRGQLETALQLQREDVSRRLLGEILVELEYCTEEHIVECLAMSLGVPFARLDASLYDPQSLSLLQRDYIEQNMVVPLFCVFDRLTVAMSEPANLFLVDEVSRLTGKEVQVVAASVRDIRRLLTTLPDAKVFVIDDLIEEESQSEVTLIETAVQDITEIEHVAGQSPVIRLVNHLVATAVNEGASDIHIEPTERSLRVRNRVDGLLHKAMEIPLHLHAGITSRIKIMGAMDISERRLPQDGRVHVMLNGRKVDLRVSTFPSHRGEKTVIRVLDTHNTALQLKELGFAEDVLARVISGVHAPNGIVLVTGPTGSGKTTTLYAALNEISSMSNNVCTVEDPIEYHLPLVNQFQVHERIGLTFSAALRTLLRQDPDVIMVGEVRDEETAKTAIQAALTGHLVLTTLHTNDAPSAITRLINMKTEPYMIGAAVNMVLAQRLVRRICSNCRISHEAPRNLRRMLEKLGLDPKNLQRGAGCRQCRNTGYRGRVGLHELLTITDDLRDLIVAGVPVAELRAAAVATGMIPLLNDGLSKVREGITTVTEVLHVAGDGQHHTLARDLETEEPR
ncbi:MAG: type II/IV secretion system protein [Planctomycetales bacterium]|nr:type II/IV secretion system protein [Planctomycetales bacterium]